MRKRLRLALDLTALALFALGLFVALAVISHDPADPPLSAVHPPNAVPANLCGEAGALLSESLIAFFGLSVYPLLVAWLVGVLALLFEGRHGIRANRADGTTQQATSWCWRLLGWLVLTPALALGAELGDECLAPLRVFSGGVLGASLYQVLAARLPALGVWLLTGASLLGGIALAGDFFWPRFFRVLARGLAGLRRLLPQKTRSHAQPSETAAIPIHHPDPVLGAFESESVRALESESAWPTLPHSHAPTRPAPDPAGALPSSPSLPDAAGGVHVEPVPVKHPAPMPAQPPANDYKLPPFDLLDDPQPFPYEEHDQQLRDRAGKLEKTFTDFGLNVRVVGINTGPVITQYEVALETGLRLHKVTRLADDLALNLKVPSVRMVAPIPGKNTVGIEIPNEHRAVVRLKEVILNAGERLTGCKIPLFLGKDTEGRPLVYDLADMPHLLIAGRTGTGKSVCMNAIILSMLMTRRPDDLRMVMIDPKMLELSEYGKIPHLMHPVVKDMRKAEAILAWAVDKMEERYDLLSRARVRSIAGYNELSPEEIYRRVKPVDEDEKARTPERMPYIVIFVDEMNDLMMTMRKEVEGHIIRLAQKSRAAGIHLVVATQKPTVDVITGLIKSNLPARICFQVSSRSDSRVVLDEMGAEKLLGKGDLLFLQTGTSTILRAQGTYAADGEITRVVEYLECEPVYSRELIQVSASASGGRESPEGFRSRDELYEPAIEVIIREGRGSVSLLQRALGIGYGRAARLIDFMAEDGIVGPYNGSNAREVTLSIEQWEQMKRGRETVETA